METASEGEKRPANPEPITGSREQRPGNPQPIKGSREERPGNPEPITSSREGRPGNFEPITGSREERPVNPDLLTGGQLLSAISTRFVQLLREHYGRGPIKAKTYALDDIIVVVLRGAGFTPLEKTMMDSGHPTQVVAMREQFQTMMALRYTGAIEELTGRKVQAFLSQAHVDPDITLEVFFIDRPLDGYGAVELTEPE